MAGSHQLPGHRAILRRRGRIPARVIMHQNDTRGRLGDGSAKHFPRVDQRTVEQAPGDEHIPEHPGPGIQGQQVKFFDLKVSQPAPDEFNDIGWLRDPGNGGPFLPGNPVGQLEGCQQPGGLRPSDTRCQEQFARRAGREPPNQPIRWLKQQRRHLGGVMLGVSGAEKDGEEFRGG